MRSFSFLPGLLALLLAATGGPAQTSDPKYDALVSQARVLLREEKLSEAAAKAADAIKLAPGRYDAHAVIALIAIRQGDAPAAKAAVAKALELAPADKKAPLESLQQKLAGLDPPPANPPGSPAKPAGPAELTGEARRKLEVLNLIAADADNAKSAGERRKLLQEYLDKSDEFLKTSPGVMAVWTLRAAIGLELNNPRLAWAAGRKLLSLGADKGDHPGALKVLAKLERKGWLTDSEPSPGPFENSLGMKFVPVAGTEVLFSVWETRKQDYEAYAKSASGVDRSWENLEFKGQKVSFAPDHPVAGTSWDDAKAFCVWLTEKERREGRLPPGASYRLPTDLEWSSAVGLPHEAGATPEARDMKIKVYPWGPQFPPPEGAGNFADITSSAAFGASWTFIQGYRDGFATTSPVGSFAANKHGLFDLAGNVWEWCEDFYDGKSGARVVRGGSWNNDDSDYLLSSYRVRNTAVNRNYYLGFRCVLVGVSSR